MTHYKLIILVIASRSKLYDLFIDKIWKPIIQYSKKHHAEILIKLLFNDIPTDDLSMNDDILKYSYTENLIPGVLQKTIDSIDYCNINYTYDYIFRTNLSSFIIIDRIIDLLDNFEKTNIYRGITDKYSNTTFCSGCGFFLSNDIAHKLVESKHLLDYTLIDDVSIGGLLGPISSNKNITRLDIITNLSYSFNSTYFNNLNESINDNHIFHVRLKNPNRNADIVIAHELTNIFYS